VVDSSGKAVLAGRSLHDYARARVESEGITESVKTWRTDVASKIVNALGLEKVMFEAADPEVFAWYVKNYGPEVNLSIDHSQIAHLETLRRGIWGTKSLWGRVLTY
jgi:phosphosulfolactate synthase (CoM biosynthesis protein A)